MQEGQMGGSPRVGVDLRRLRRRLQLSVVPRLCSRLGTLPSHLASLMKPEF